MCVSFWMCFFVFAMVNFVFGMFYNKSWMGLVHIAHKSWMDGPLENRKIPTELSWCGLSNDDNKLKVGTLILAQMDKIHWGPIFGNWRTMSKEYAFWAFEEQALRLPSTVCTRSSAKRAGNILCKHCLCLCPLSLLALVAPMGCSIAIFEDDTLLKDQDQDKDQGSKVRIRVFFANNAQCLSLCWHHWHPWTAALQYFMMRLHRHPRVLTLFPRMCFASSDVGGAEKTFHCKHTQQWRTQITSRKKMELWGSTIKPVLTLMTPVSIFPEGSKICFGYCKIWIFWFCAR